MMDLYQCCGNQFPVPGYECTCDEDCSCECRGCVCRDTGTTAALTRLPGCSWAPLVRGQRVTVNHGDFSGEFRVTDVQPSTDGGETYTLEPAADVDARDNT